jgi:hypothetical protein
LALGRQTPGKKEVEEMEDTRLELSRNPREFEPFFQSDTKSGTIDAWLSQCPIDDASLKESIVLAVLELVGKADQGTTKDAGFAPNRTPPPDRLPSRRSQSNPD